MAKSKVTGKPFSDEIVGLGLETGTTGARVWLNFKDKSRYEVHNFSDIDAAIYFIECKSEHLVPDSDARGA